MCNIVVDRVYFTPNRALRGLTMVGLPGTEGQLMVVAESQIIGQDLVLLIDFKLAGCPVGYCPPKVIDRREVSVVCVNTYVYVCLCMSCMCVLTCACAYVWICVLIVHMHVFACVHAYVHVEVQHTYKHT